ncbi:MAG: DinB family protein [Chloroflexi bacterium AL-W]|nr:DinB family protein [Chloroflexi bacterium AL-N1]NOK66845.1 DinB family protein [Chloroflexi bacterium AL-N10]NOK74863.1 DinB family protein [Chloroflexi bacterium AL-N5]NOK81448.1 DinB family protein [Chloroflexi bacterium AL-W]NOK88917.1 DinB family protein [Chloroflexi bacterium AL-N15]
MSRTRKSLILHPLQGYALPIGHALACLQEGRKRTLQSVAELSIHDLDAHVEGSPNSIGSLLYHIAGIELDWLFGEILEQNFPAEFQSLFPLDARDKDGRLSVVAGIELQAHLQRLAFVREVLLKKLKFLDAEDFYRPRSLSRYDVNPAWVLNHLLQHETEHRNQIAHIRQNLQ